MEHLQKRFGRLLAAHRRKRALTQHELAERSSLSVDTIAKLETGATAPSFRTIEALSQTLAIDPAELFGPPEASGHLARPALTSATIKLAALSDTDLAWAMDLIDLAMRRKG